MNITKEDLDLDVAIMIEEGRERKFCFVARVKAYREITGAGLKEAYNHVLRMDPVWARSQRDTLNIQARTGGR